MKEKLAERSGPPFVVIIESLHLLHSIFWDETSQIPKLLGAANSRFRLVISCENADLYKTEDEAAPWTKVTQQQQPFFLFIARDQPTMNNHPFSFLNIYHERVIYNQQPRKLSTVTQIQAPHTIHGHM